ncbi:hypothetical protein RN001_010576 [Aquatica leii]|uniref:CN hydrolase domain-containing protein n=1 Tax=Aquatica leii TaxID=1421715 RepID=A0AAN7SQD9_9COLE|nr:hypothetical protein RN001_010576 [Aquatica leii]
MGKIEKINIEMDIQTETQTKDKENGIDKEIQTVQWTIDGKEKINDINNIKTYEEWMQIADKEWTDKIYKKTKIEEGHPLEETKSTNTVCTSTKEAEENIGPQKIISINFPELKDANGEIEIKTIKTEYTAAVVEFYPDQAKDLEPEERLKSNIDGYLKILDKIIKKKPKPDIVIFPEATLKWNSVIVNHRDELPFTVEISNSTESLCTTENTTFLTRLACAAQKSKTYLVINLSERERCKSTKCAEDGWNIYNANVVLDRNGSVVSKYRKYHLFAEPFMNRTATPEIVIFDTDFGEKFASFTCFDIWFKKPALDLVYKHQVTNIIFPTMWFSQLPFVTILAAGANDPKIGSGGSGIHLGRKGSLVSGILGNTRSQEFVATVPQLIAQVRETTQEIDKKAKQMDGFVLLPDDLTKYTSKVIQFGERKINETVCHNGFCCNFKMSLQWNNKTTKKYYVYHMVVYSGVLFAYYYDMGVDVCGVVACLNQNLRSCSRRFPNYDDVSWPVTFKHIQIKAQFENDDQKFQYPNSLLSNIKPLPVEDFDWTSRTLNTTIEKTFTLKQPQNRLMTFAIYGRDFNKDLILKP